MGASIPIADSQQKKEESAVRYVLTVVGRNSCDSKKRVESW